MEEAGIPTVNITAVPTVSKMIGVTRVLRGMSVPNVLGDHELPPEQEKALRKKMIRRALEILRTEVDEKQIFSMEGTE